MKIIVINDSYGLMWAMAYTPENIQKLREAAIESGLGLGDDEIPNGRVWGNLCEIIDTDKLQDFPQFNPFM